MIWWFQGYTSAFLTQLTLQKNWAMITKHYIAICKHESEAESLSLILLSSVLLSSCPITMILVFILQASPWETLHKHHLCLQIHTWSLLKDFTKARGVWRAATLDRWVHQAGPHLRAGWAEFSGWRQVLPRWLCRNFCYFCFCHLCSALFLNCPTLSFPDYSSPSTAEQDSKRSGECFCF